MKITKSGDQISLIGQRDWFTGKVRLEKCDVIVALGGGRVIIPFLTVIYSRIFLCISQFLHRSNTAYCSIRPFVVICP